MKRALVVLSGEDSDEALLDEAAQYAAGADAELVALMLITEEEWENDQEVLDTIAAQEGVSYDTQNPKEYAKKRAENIVEEALEGRNVSVEPVGALADGDDRADTIINIADQHDCSHVFLRGRRRTPAGKAIFGDTTQAVILNFDGFVTVSTTS